MKNISDSLDDIISKLDIIIAEDHDAEVRHLKAKTKGLEIELAKMTEKYSFLCNKIKDSANGEQISLFDYGVGREGPWN